ncbi:MAG: protein yaiE [Oscillospiraceae bacterium]|nr:protein yaiE [Oscillospiraceae bacterium]
MDQFQNVTVVKQANIYFEGRVTSRTVLFEDGTRKTLGMMLPGEYEFGTGDRELMEILAGSVQTLLPGNGAWAVFGPGESFQIPANSKFQVKMEEPVDYCCSYLKE